ncbi:GDP dissociation inhibitor-domain-containing protein [Lineolata rhizophorae]|uniref:GDP dissociation inhibitor-domain-containing protein n=1 Tax=Lineolata rhizophorae TaxID=578093 RepID=A0A6A6NS61_9PEZI|nr:GDP dissociation inhibitor-domain-containing protein [Lineolata rhizophorae]
MDALEGTHWDVIVSGTGLQQSLLVLALSRSNKKILHVDRNDFYGGNEAAFSLQEARSWVIERPSSYSLGARAVEKPSGPDESGASTKLGPSRAYSLSLAPHLIFTRSALLPILVSSKVHRQLEFLPVGSWWVFNRSPEDPSSSPTAGPKLTKIPSSREDVFASDAIEIRSKRALVKFLRFVAEYEAQADVWEPFASRPFTDFLVEHFKLPKDLHDPLLALTLSLEHHSHTTTILALQRIARHLRSMGVFGAGFGSLIPKWGGLSEIAQVACRAGAVGGAVYILGTGVVRVESDEKVGEQNDDGSSQSRAVRVGLGGGISVTADWIVGSRDDLPSRTTRGGLEDAATPGSSTSQSVSRAIFIVSSPLVPLFPPISEGSPRPAGAVVYFPSGSISTEESDQGSNAPPIYVFAHSSDTGECPSGQTMMTPN